MRTCVFVRVCTCVCVCLLIRVVVFGRIQVWPGYATAISECTGGVLMNVDISHKVTRKENARDVLTALRRSGQAIKEAAEKQLVGEVVMTRLAMKRRNFGGGGGGEGV